MIRLFNDPDTDIQVLIFDSTEEARSIGEHLAKMGDGCRYYARGPDGLTEQHFHDVLDRAKLFNASTQDAIKRDPLTKIFNDAPRIPIRGSWNRIPPMGIAWTEHKLSLYDRLAEMVKEHHHLYNKWPTFIISVNTSGPILACLPQVIPSPNIKLPLANLIPGKLYIQGQMAFLVGNEHFVVDLLEGITPGGVYSCWIVGDEEHQMRLKLEGAGSQSG